jgi:plasmid stabilization system protein ParE
MKIFLTTRANKNYEAIRSYIKNEWGERVAKAFENKVADFLDLLANFPEMGSVEVVEKQIRGFQLTKQTRIFYRIKKENIIILTFFDVKQDPNKKIGKS